MTLRLLAGILCLASVTSCWAQRYDERNLVLNPSFEVLDDNGLPLGWRFHDAGAGATMTVDATIAHTGSHSVKLTNPHPLQPHVYGTLATRVRVQPGRTYTLSLYARSDNPGHAWFGCGPKWERRQRITATGGKWKRFSLTFTTYSDEKWLEPRINVDSATDGLWIDSVQLELGEEATEFVTLPVLQPGQARLTIKPARVGANLVENGSFERWRGKWPEGWRWDKRNTDSTMTMDETRARSGRRCVRITNNTRFGPHIYGQLVYAKPIKVKPNTTYTVSAWIHSDSPGVFWIGGFQRWRARAYAPRSGTAGQWRRIHVTYTTGPVETEARVMINTDSPTPGVWIDDFKVEEGDGPTPFVPEDVASHPRIELEVAGRGAMGMLLNPWMPDRYPPDRYLFGRELCATGYVLGGAGRRLKLRATADRKVLVQAEKPVPAGPCARFEFTWELSNVPSPLVQLEVALDDGRTRVTRQLNLITQRAVHEGLAALRPQVEKLRHKVQAMGGRGNYPRVTLTIADNFMRWIAQDVEYGEIARAWAQLQTVTELVQAALKKTQWPLAPKYVTGPLAIDGPSFVGDVVWPDGRRERRPVIFIGMGPFGQARRDAGIFPDYGFNIMQVEFGPNSVLPSENEYSDRAINEFLEVCDRAAKAGVKVNLLISPHYFPGWALQKWPHLRDCSGGFFRYCVHAPQARQVIEKFLRYTIPKIKDHPALHSICLSNEPISTNLQKCRFVRAHWHEWLRRKYGSAANMNEAWGTDYAGFDDVPVPPARFKPSALVYDFVRFNQEEFAGFHRFMADIIHEMAPNLPVHAKMMICAVFGPSSHGPWSIAPELFAQFCEINGNDAWRAYRPAGEWATTWQDEIMGYELQRCAREAPVFNSEDHIIPDRNVNWQSPTYIYNVYWQGAVHGRGASSAWVWERTYDPSSSFCGSILHRPACIEAAGRCTLDLNRLALEVTALQRAKPRVAVVYALSGYVWDADYDDAMEAAWRASAFVGHKTGFIFERQLEALADGRPLPEYLSDLRVILLAGLHHLSARAVKGLQQFADGGGRIIAIGGVPDRDEHDKPLSLKPPTALTIKTSDDRALMAQLAKALARLGVQTPVTLTDERGAPLYGVEWFAVPWQGGWLVNVSNYRHEEPHARLSVGSTEVRTARELISSRTVTFPLRIPSLQPMLLLIRP